jgi:hypothetical protein
MYVAMLERRPRVLITVIVSAALAFNVPCHFEFIDEECFDVATMKHSRHIVPSKMRLDVDDIFQM